MMRGKLVLLPFPFDDLSAAKVRPALCLTDEIGAHQHVVVAFVSSQVPTQPEPSDLVLDAAGADFAATGLRVASVIKLHRLLTVSKGIMLRGLGSLTPALQAQVGRGISVTIQADLPRHREAPTGRCGTFLPRVLRF